MRNKRFLGRALSLILTVTMLAGNMSLAVYADTPADTTVTEAVTEESSEDVSQTTETESQTVSDTDETVTNTVDTGEEASEETTETTEDETSGEEMSETEEETATVSDEDEKLSEAADTELPYGLKGMPEGYVLSNKEKAKREDLKEHDVLNTLKNMVPGKDYVEDELLFSADTQEEAEQIAAAYNAVLDDYIYEMGVAKLSGDITVLQAVEIGLSDEYNMPVVEANYLVSLEEPVDDSEDEDVDLLGAIDDFDMPEAGTYSDWVYGDPGEGTAPILSNADPYLKNSYANKQYQWQHEMINSYGAWSATTGSSSIKVAVIDTGVDASHEELSGRVTQIKVESIAAAPASGQKHGTHCAGIIAASLNNGKGGAGIAPGVSIISLNVFGSSEQYEVKDLCTAIRKAADNGAQIINMSLGGAGYHSEIQAAVDYAYEKNVTVIAAMGNNAGNLKNYPAACKHVIAVSSVNRDGAKSGFTNYGSWADIAAPGSHIMSSIPGGYEQMSGTSMATPVVSGVAALYMSKFGNPGPDQMEKILKASTVKSGSSQTGNIVNAYKMFAVVKTAPVITAYNSSNVKIEKPANGVTPGSYVKISREATDSKYGTDYIIYTTDGKTPAVKNGEIVSGQIYEEGTKILLDEAPSATTVTVKALIVSEVGTVGKVSVLKVKTPDKTDKAPEPVKTVTIDNTKLNLEYRDGSGASNKGTITITALKDKAGEDISPTSCKHEWVSSNPKVATVKVSSASKVEVTAKGKGSAKITLKLLDGSKKTAVCNVTVTRLVDDVHVTGQAIIAPGTSASYKANVVPATANNKKVTWEVYENSAPWAPVEGVTISQSGKLSVGKDVDTGTVLRVSASPKDGTLVGDGYTIVKVGEKANKVEIKTVSGSNNIVKYTYNKNGVLTSAQIYSANIPNKSGAEDYISFSASVNDLINSSAWAGAFDWSSSNTKVLDFKEVSHNSSVTVKGLSAGTAKLTCALKDGSGKKMSITVKVINPASGITLLPNDKEFYNIAVGKTFSAKSSLGSAYGKPSVTAVEYTKEAIGTATLNLGESYSDGAGNTGNVVGKMVGGVMKIYTDGSIKSSFDLSDAVTISNKTGKISVNKKKWDQALAAADYPADTIVKMRVTAHTTDGTDYSDSVIYYVQPAMKKYYSSSSVAYTASVGSLAPDNVYYIYMWSDRYVDDVVGSSSNTKVAGAAYVGCVHYDYNKEYIYSVFNWFGWKIRDEYKYHYDEYCYIFALKPSAKGSGKLNTQVKDGSGKKAGKSFKIVQ